VVGLGNIDPPGALAAGEGIEVTKSKNLTVETVIRSFTLKRFLSFIFGTAGFLVATGGKVLAEAGDEKSPRIINIFSSAHHWIASVIGSGFALSLYWTIPCAIFITHPIILRYQAETRHGYTPDPSLFSVGISLIISFLNVSLCIYLVVPGSFGR
jgi:hypothetical protein